MLAHAEVAALRASAAAPTRAVFDDAGGRPVEVMARVARVVPVEVLVAALDLPPVPAGHLATIAGADQAVADLVAVFGGVPDEGTAARIGLLVQACGATAGLIGNAVLTMRRSGARLPPDRVVAETLLRDPPVRTTRRRHAGRVVPVDLAAPGLPFGAGPHECPGRDHAVAIAEGVVEAVLGGRLTAPGLEYLPSAARHVPTRLTMTA